MQLCSAFTGPEAAGSLSEPIPTPLRCGDGLVCMHRFNQDFDALVKQKHADADRLADLNTRVDELIRELVKIHLVLNPAAAVPDTDDAASTPPAATDDAAAPSTTASGGSSGTTTARDGPSGPVGPSGPQHDVPSAAQLSADLAAGRLVPFWSPDENMEDLLLNIQPGEIKVWTKLTARNWTVASTFLHKLASFLSLLHIC